MIEILTAIALAGVSLTAQAVMDADQKKETAIFGIATDGSCIGGHNPFSDGTTARIRALSEAALKNYISLAGSGSAVDVRPTFTTKKSILGWGENGFTNKKVVLVWSRDGQVGDIKAVDDPVARAIATAPTDAGTLLKVDQFLVAGAKLSATGMWRVFAPGEPNKVIGWYRGRFLRQNLLGGQAWDLVSLELTTGATEPARITQYCAEPGDVEYNRERVKEKKAERERKKRERAATKS